MGRKPCCDKVGLKRGPWTLEEDHRLMNFILNNGIHCWRIVPKLAGLLRCGKSCRLRWINYLRPDLKRGGFTDEEEDRIMELHSQLGNRWSKIASHFPGRTDNEIKNHWNTKIKKKMKHLGLDPVTHKPMDIITTEQTGSNQEIEPNTSSNIQEENEPREEEIKEQTPKDEITIETTNTLTKSDIDEEEEELMTKNYETLCTEISLNSSLNNSVSIDNYSNNIINISRSESSSYFVEDYSSISLEQWDMDLMDPLIPWDQLYTHLDDSLFLL